MTRQLTFIKAFVDDLPLRIDFESVNFFFANIRQVLEAENTSSIYPKISLFCNWLLHPKLDRKNTAKDILDEMQNIIIEHYLKGNDIGLALSKAIDMAKLKLEIKDFLQNSQISDIRFNEQSIWSEIEINLLKLLLEKPIIYQTPINLKPQVKFDFSLIGFQLVDYDNSICLDLLTEELNQLQSKIVIQLPRIK